MSDGVALAVAAHPDDIEFMMGGTLWLLREAGYATHYLNLASGSCGSAEHSAARLRWIRRREGQAAAAVLGAEYHGSLVDDLEIFYEDRTLRRLAAVVREIRPTVLLVPSPQDYMEDHTNACRLAVSAAFARGMRNYRTLPRRRPVAGEVTYVDTTAVQAVKAAALAKHQSQQRWLDASQRINQYLHALDAFGREVGRMSGRFRYAEGWRRHLHYGFCGEADDPLRAALGRGVRVDRRYEAMLMRGGW
jgi:LmbE family N-acetylglucosaminyl deacetylase